MPTAESPVGNMLVTVKSSELQRTMLAEIPFLMRILSGLIFQISRRICEPGNSGSSAFSPNPGWIVGAVTWMPSPMRARLLLPSTRAPIREATSADHFAGGNRIPR